MRGLTLALGLSAAALLGGCAGDDESPADPGAASATEAPTEPAAPGGTETGEAAAPPIDPAAMEETVETDEPAEIGDRVVVAYEILLEDGETLEAAETEIVLGQGALPPALETALQGVTAGDNVEVELGPDEAFGERDEALVVDVPLDQLPEGVEAGDELVTNTGMPVTVVEVGEESAVVDTNHPLAGESATFRFEILSVLRPV